LSIISSTSRLTPVAWALLSLISPGAGADDSTEDVGDPDYETVVRDYSVKPTDDPTGFGETIEVGDETGRMTSVSDVVSEAVGVQVRRMGGLGSYGSASIRGSTPGQVPVYLDGVLLNAGGAASVNLGDLSLDLIERVEVYRGATPAAFGSAGIGGVIALRTRAFDEPSSRLALTYGSWDTARLLAMRAASLGDARAMAVLSVSGSRGDFEYLNRNGTLLNDEDDRMEARRNNHHVAYASLLKLDGVAGGLRWTVANDLASSVRGVAGIESVPTSRASLRSLRDAISARGEVPLDPGLDLSLDVGYLALREDFDDGDDEIGLGSQRTLTATDAVGGGGTLGIELGEHNALTVRLETRYERLRQEDLVSGERFAPKRRARTAIVLGHAYSPAEGFRVSPVLRLEQHHGVFSGGTPAGVSITSDGGTFDDLYVQPALGFRYELAPGLTLRMNAGRYVRAPELGELFGDRGSVIGNPDLDPEVSLNADAGLVYLLRGAGPLDLARVEAALFGAKAKDLIAYVQNSQNTIRPQNVSRADISGVEASVRLAMWGRLSLHGNYTWLCAINRSDYPYYAGRRLPGRPAHEAYGRIELGDEIDGWAPGIWFDVDYAGRNYMDQANLEEDVLARLLLGLGTRLEWVPAGIGLTVEIRNLLDTTTTRDSAGRLRPLRDFEAFPLPGRTVLATLSWRT